jgi:hypothetical protein
MRDRVVLFLRGTGRCDLYISERNEVSWIDQFLRCEVDPDLAEHSPYRINHPIYSKRKHSEK